MKTLAAAALVSALLMATVSILAQRSITAERSSGLGVHGMVKQRIVKKAHADVAMGKGGRGH